MIYQKATIRILMVLKAFLFLVVAIPPESILAQVADPTVTTSVASTLQQTVSVTVSDGTTGAAIHYTTDGTAPTTASATVTNNGTLLLSQNATLKVQAFNGTSNPSNVITAKPALSGIISSGDDQTLALENNGTVMAWGNNLYGQLGNGDSSGSPQSSPVQVLTAASVPLTGIVAIAAGTEESFAVDNNGNVWAWGLNTNGQLGNGGTSNAIYATQISGLTGIISIASSQSHTLALKNDGSVWAWGANTSGQVGNGAVAAWVTLPTPVVAPNTQTGSNLQGIVAIAAGAHHSLAMDSSGKVYAWGDDSYGQLGDSDTTFTAQSMPVLAKISGMPFSGGTGVAAGAKSSFAVKSDGSVWSWGDNSAGQAGLGTVTPVSVISPTQITNLTGTVVGIGNQSAYGTNGTVWTWGDNTTGRLGLGIVGSYSTLPFPVNFGATSSPTLTTTGGGQTVNDGSYSTALGLKASSGGNPVANNWVTFYVSQGGGLLALNTSGTQSSPILELLTGSNGQTANFYYQEPSSGSGTTQVTAASGSSQTLYSIIAGAGAVLATDSPTMPEWGLIVMAALLVYFAIRQKAQCTGQHCESWKRKGSEKRLFQDESLPI